MPKKYTSKRNNDPHAKREAAQYETPLPSRELILEVITEQGIPVSVDTLYELLEIGEEEQEVLGRRLNAMEREGQLMRNRKKLLCIPDKIDAIPGVIQGHQDGFGFLVPDDKDKNPDDVFLSNKQMQQVMHGDRAMVRINGLDRRGRPEGAIVEVLERMNKTIVGRVMQGAGVTIIAAEDKRINQDILIPYHLDMDAKVGQIVEVEMTDHPSKHAHPMGKVIQILGNYADSGMEIEIALRKHKLPHQFAPAALKQAKDIPKTVQPKDYEGRIDLRELPLITIDGETARDFDDAVFAESQGDGWRLVVAIADVSYYVTPDDALDRDAIERGNSIYFPRRVIPMLPEALSNGLCSLNPDVERLCMICDMEVNADGVVDKYKFYPSVMLSKARMTYTKVADMLANPNGEVAKEYAHVMPHVQNLYALYQAMLVQRKKRGAIEFDTSETMMLFNDEGKIDSIVPTSRNEAHKIIEECMLAANVCAASYLEANKHAAVYRVHEGPSAEKLELLRTFMSGFGFGVAGGDKPHAKDYAQLMSQIKGRPDEQLLQTVLLRSMQQAVYSPDNQGHFGLAYEAYTHFTSPIRRYPDLLVHRAIKAVVNKETYKVNDWAALGAHCSLTERRADEASRDVTNWLKCYYMQDKVGEVFEGTVSAVTSFGVFVALDDAYVEGLLHVTELGNDYFHYEKALHEMVGERTGAKYRLGDRVTIKVARVDLETTKIDFSLVDKKGNLELAGESKGKKNPTERQSRTKPKGLPKKSGSRKPKAAKTSKYSGEKSTNSRQKSTKKKR
ncbi:MAG TPA: ribonuclease R [Methylophilaceae bacterium]|jgi:ribonuclease R|nr:ribonuclease R [Methylophilaceae bacterium]